MSSLFDASFQGLLLVLQWKAFLMMLLGIGLGFFVGLLPGIGGLATLALMVPFIYAMSPAEAFAFLLGMHSVTATTGDITSILFGVPGEASAAATVLDGHAMAKKGEAGRALGAALMSSLIGALVGAFAMAFSIPVIRPVVLAFGSPELFMVTIVGIAFIVSLSGTGSRAILRGLLAGGFGLLLSTAGSAPQSGILRFTFGQLYLWGGIEIVPAVIGLFAVPEIIDLAVRGTSIAGEAPTGKLGGILEGVKDTFRYFGVTLRCSLVGTLIGILPGMGGSVAQWMAYGHAKQSAWNKEEWSLFGKGDVRGVLGPGAANNSKEGGSLIPTVAFGVPGSGSMAILLAAFLILGLVPGPDMLTKHLDITFSMVWTLVIANVITVAICFLFVNELAKLTLIRGSILIPFIVFLGYIGAYTANNSMGDIIVFIAFGFLGYLMIRCRWPRAPFILGMILGKIAENYFYISTTRYGFSWVFRPVVLLLLGVILFVIFYSAFRFRSGQRQFEAT